MQHGRRIPTATMCCVTGMMVLIQVICCLVKTPGFDSMHGFDTMCACSAKLICFRSKMLPNQMLMFVHQTSSLVEFKLLGMLFKRASCPFQVTLAQSAMNASQLLAVGAVASLCNWSMWGRLMRNGCMRKCGRHHVVHSITELTDQGVGKVTRVHAVRECE